MQQLQCRTGAIYQIPCRNCPLQDILVKQEEILTYAAQNINVIYIQKIQKTKIDDNNINKTALSNML